MVERPSDEHEVAEWATNAGVIIRGYRAGGYDWIAAPGVAVYRFAATGPVVASALGDDTERVESLWLSSVLPLVVQARGTQVLHASAVSGRNGIVALCGLSGAGKTTLAAALMRRGHQLVADDALAFRVEAQEIVAHPLPFELRLRPGTAGLLGVDAATMPVRALPKGRLSAVVVLKPISRPDTTTVSLKPAFLPIEAGSAEIVAEMLPHLYCFSLREGKEALVRELFALLRSLPVLALDYAQRPESISGMCEELEELLGR